MATYYYAMIDDHRNVQSAASYEDFVSNNPYWLRLSEDDYNKVYNYLFKDNVGVNIDKDCKITTYIKPGLSLGDKAQHAVDEINAQAPMMVAMGETFGPKTKAYVQALQAIIGGTDTTSTDLPAKPDALTE